MKTITKSSIVKTEIVCSEDGKYTYELTKKIEGVKGDKAVIILLYPTRTIENLCTDDSTLLHLVAHMQEMGISELKILNLFSKVSAYKMSVRGLKVDEENMQYINELMTDSKLKDYKFIIAWGSAMASSYGCQKSKVQILNMYKNYYPQGKFYQIISSDTKLRYLNCPHPLFLGIRGGRALWSLAEIHITPKMLEDPPKTKKLNEISLKIADTN